METYKSVLESVHNLIKQLPLGQSDVKEENVEVAEQDALIVVSNRLPFILEKNSLTGDIERKSSAGGLVTAVAPVVARCKGKWVGWTGVFYGPNEEPDPIPEADINDKTPTAGIKAEQIVPVYCDERRFKNYYDGCCNGGLWPLFHSMQDRAVFKDDHWQDYVAVNKLFAEKTVEAIRNVREANSNITPLIWIHDSQLMLAASTIRELSKKDNIPIKIGFFLHIPFPPFDILSTCPWSKEILCGLLDCGVIGFHIGDYCLNFIDCCHRLLSCRVDRAAGIIEYKDRHILVRAMPIGIPYERFVKLAEEAPRVIKPTTESVILGVERLDYTKGLIHRLQAFEKLLEDHPEYKEKVNFMQIAVPSRTNVQEYQDLKEEIDKLVGKINGKFSTANWSPIRYIYGCIPQSELASFYRDASVALVTPLRDGMNLVCKEFVACQTGDPGVLILSRFTGAAELMQEALLCSPYKIEEVVEALHRALQMPLEERTTRMQSLQRREKKNDVNTWMYMFMNAMESNLVKLDEKIITPTSYEEIDRYLNHHLGNAENVALLLDYDGTLAPITTHPNLAVLPDETRETLERLSNLSDVFIGVISGRDVNDVKEKVGIKTITYAGNHGLSILHPDGSKFLCPIPKESEQKLTLLSRDLQAQVCQDGAWVENKGLSLTWHYRNTPEKKQTHLITAAKSLIKSYGFRCITAQYALEARHAIDWDKGYSVFYILRSTFGPDWNQKVRIIYAGDDSTDEDALKILKSTAATFRVTTNPTLQTYADMRIPDTDSVLTLLKWVERFMSRRAPKALPIPTSTLSEQASPPQSQVDLGLSVQLDGSSHENSVDKEEI
jgi:trehalose 6-phosphate synthase/phosphatase